MSTLAPPIELRRGRPADLPTIATIMASAFDPRFGEAWTQAQCMGILALPGVWLTIARRDDRDAGFALARSIHEDAELLLLATGPAMRRGGIGSSLLRSIELDAHERGATRLMLEVRAGNPAVELYLRHGFAKIGERRQYYRGSDGKTHDALTYARDLP